MEDLNNKIDELLRTDEDPDEALKKFLSENSLPDVRSSFAQLVLSRLVNLQVKSKSDIDLFRENSLKLLFILKRSAAGGVGEGLSEFIMNSRSVPRTRDLRREACFVISVCRNRAMSDNPPY